MDNLQLIQNKIYEIRGLKVMLDFDLAKIYGIETKVLKQAVKRNIKRFEGEDFMFEITKEELSRSQIVTLNKGRGYNFKYLPYAFTELGVAMLSSVLNSDTAIETNRGIMRAFVAIRQLITTPPITPTSQLEKEVRELKEYLKDVFTDQTDINKDTTMQMDLINQALAELQVKNKVSNRPKKIGFQLPEE